MEINAILLCDSHHGQYIPQVFAQTINWELCHDYNQWAKEALLEGPDNQDYWEAMTDIEDNLIIKSKGKEYFICFLSGDLWAVDADTDFEALENLGWIN